MDLPITNKPTLTRRLFIRRGLASVSGFYLLPMLEPINVKAQAKPKLRGNAEFCIFFFLSGGASHLDTFDFKEGHWTPPDFDVRTIKPGLVLPYGLFPKISNQIDRLALVRSIEAWESAHTRAQYYLQAGHPPSPAREKDIPGIGAVVAYEYEARKRPTDFLPPFVAMNFGGSLLVAEACLPNPATPLVIETKEDLPFLVPSEEKAIFERRWELLQKLEASERVGVNGFAASKIYKQFESFDHSAFKLMSSPRLPQILTLNEDDRKRYGSSALGDASILARNLVQADAGTHYICISHNGWDLHANIFDKSSKLNHYTLCHELDSALTALMDDLGKVKAADGKSFLDKTFIVAMGEFGRTGGDLTVNKGRDHNRMAQTALFAGAGVIGGRAIGATDDKGWKVTKTDWDKKRSIYTEDAVSTIYSQLGIDWTKKITQTPSGRDFQYLEGMSGTNFIDISEVAVLFG